MVISSYQTLARYGDCAYRFQTRGIGEIRQKHRETLYSERIGQRFNKHFVNRNVPSDPDEAVYYCNHSDPGSSSGYDEPDYQPSTDSEHCDNWNWDTFSPTEHHWSHPNPSPAPTRSSASSPSLSVVSSDWSSIHSDTFRLPTPQNISPPPRHLSRQSRQRPVSRRQLLKSRKQLNANNYNACMVQSDLEQFTAGLSQFGSSPKEVSNFVCSGVSVDLLSSAISCPNIEVSDQALHLLITLVQNSLLDIQTIYFILQQGILISFKITLGHHNGCQLPVIARFFSIIMRQEPRSAAFMIELMYTSQLLTLLDDALSFGTRDEMYSSFELYACMFHTVQDQLLSKSPPIVSDHQNTKDAGAYNPIRSLKRILSSRLFEILSDKYIKQAEFVDDLLLQCSMDLVIRGLYLIYLQLQEPKRDAGLAINAINTLKGIDLSNSLKTVINRVPTESSLLLERLSEFRDRYESIFKVFLQYELILSKQL